jgi:hypothetical protein
VFEASIAPNLYHCLYPHKSIPTFLSAYYKTVLGFSQSLCFLLLACDGVAEESLKGLGKEKDFLEWIDAHQWLHGQSQVCAGSPQMIGRFFSVLCGVQDTRKLHSFEETLHILDFDHAAIGGHRSTLKNLFLYPIL